MGALTTAYVAVLPDMKRFGPELRVGLRKVDVSNAGRDAGTRFSSGMSGGVKRTLGHGLAAVGIAAGAAFAGALTKGFARLSAIENAEAKLRGLGHSAKTVNKIMVDALASVKGTAFGLDEAGTLAATAVAAGIKPGRELQRTLKLVADAATIGGTSLGEMGAIFNQVAASNKVQGDTINQLNERGIPILKLLAKVMGVSQAEVSRLASQGKIDFATFQKAMEQGLGGAALKSGNTASGAFKNMGAAFSRVGAALLKGVFPQIGAGFGTITKALDAITPGALRFGQIFGTALSKAAAGVKAFAYSLRTGFTEDEGTVIERIALAIRGMLPTLRTLGQFVTGTLLPAWLSWYKFLFSQMVPILQQVGGFITTSVIPAFRVVARFIATTVVPAFLSIRSAVMDLIRVVAPIIGQLVGVVLSKFREMSPEVKSIWNSVKQIIVGVMFIIREVITSVTHIIQMVWSRWGTQIKAIVGSVFGTLIKVISGAMKIIAGVINLFVALIKGDWKGAWNAVKQIFAGVWQVIKAILVNYLKQIDTVLRGTLTSILTRWFGFWTRIRTQAGDAMNAVYTKIAGVLGKIGGAFQAAKTNIGRIWSGVRAVVSAPIEWVKNNVYNRPLVPVWNRVAGLVGAKPLAAYATGGIDDSYGIRPGYTPGRDTHLIAVGGGEPVLRPEAGRALGRGWVDGVNRSARTGGVSGVQNFLSGGGEGFAGGGIVGWIKNTVGSAGSAIAGLAGKMKNWALGGLRDAAAKVLSPLRGVIRDNLSGSPVKDTAGKVANKALDLILDKIKAADNIVQDGGGGPVIGTGSMAKRALAHVGMGYEIGKCLQFARTMAGAPGMGGDAVGGWNRARHKHHGIGPTSTAAWWGGGQGHVAVNVGNGRIVTTDYPHAGRIGLTSIGRLNAAWGKPYRGWTNDINGVITNPVGMAGGAIVKGGRGGVLAHIGEGARDEIVAPLPRRRASAVPSSRPAVMELGPKSIAAIASALTVEIDGRQVARAVRYQTVRGTS